MITPVVLSGGSGTRLWPISRKLFPKQLMPMTGGNNSLLQSTLQRLKGLPNTSGALVICNEEHRFLVASQLQEIEHNPLDIILEPAGRNTAPAVALAALGTIEDDAILLVLPADHHIVDMDAFIAAVSRGLPFAELGKLVTFGIIPTKPETGYGYIKGGKPLENSAFTIEKFVEKPDLASAKEYLEDSSYLWNSGMFLFKASNYLEELQNFSPEILNACRLARENGVKDLDFFRLDKEAFIKCPEDSIDYAVFERTKKGVVVPLSCGWSDVGSWSALHEVRDKDENGNVTVGDIVTSDVNESYLHSTGRLIAGLGLSNIAVIETKDAVFVSPLNKVQDVKKIVNKLKRQKRDIVHAHCRVYRPWGNYEGIDLGERYQVKRITVYPGQQLSLQKHFHRSEHWIVVSGTAKIVNGDKEILLTEDQSTYIPLGALHRLENPGKVNLELIEVQTGSYLGEDDIERLSDIYGRIEPAKDED